jgi:hypothetical protein
MRDSGGKQEAVESGEEGAAGSGRELGPGGSASSSHGRSNPRFT